MFQKKLQGKSKYTFIFNKFPSPTPPKFVPFMRYCGKYSGARQALDGNVNGAENNQERKSHPEFVIFIALPLLQWLHKRTSVLRFTYNAFIVSCLFLS
jgi:hypothetical protein